MGTRDDEYDYLFKGNFVLKGGWLTACSVWRQQELRKSSTAGVNAKVSFTE